MFCKVAVDADAGTAAWPDEAGWAPDEHYRGGGTVRLRDNSRAHAFPTAARWLASLGAFALFAVIITTGRFDKHHRDRRAPSPVR